MAEPIFLDVLPKFGFAAMEAGLEKFKSASADAGKAAGDSLTGGTDAALKKLQDSYTAASNTVADASKRIASANGDIATSGQKLTEANGRVEVSVQRLSEAIERYGAGSSQAIAAENAWTASLARADTALHAHALAFNEARTASEAHAASLAAQSTAHRDMQAAQEASTASTLAFGRALNTAGAVSAAAFTGAMYESAKAAGDFQQSQMRLVSSAGETQQGMKVVSDGILKLAGDVGYSAGQLSQGMYTVESAGYRGAEGLKVITAAAQGAKAENADLGKVTDGLTTSMNDFGYAPDKAALVMSKLVTAVGESKANFEEFTGSLHSVEPAAAAAKISLDDVYGSLARMTQSGTSADQATQNMADAIRHLQGPTDTMAAAMAKFGISATDVQQHLSERGLSGTVAFLADTIRNQLDPAGNVSVTALNENAQAALNASDMMSKMSPAAAQVAQAFANGTMSRKEFTAAVKNSSADDAAQLQQFGALELKLDGFSNQFKNGRSLVETYAQALKEVTGDVAGANVALQLAGDPKKQQETADAIKKVADTTTDADGKVKGFNETQSTLNAKMADAKAAFGAAAIELGDVFIPTLTTVATDLAKVGTFLAEHKQVLADTTIVVGGFATAWLGVKVALAVGNTFTAIASGIDLVIGKFGLMGGAAKTAAIDVDTASASEVAAQGRVAAAADAATVSVKGVGAAALSAASLVGGLAFASTQASDAFNSWSDSHPEVQRRDDQGRIIRGRESQGGGPGTAAPQIGPLPNLPATQGPGAEADRQGNRAHDWGTTPPPPTVPPPPPASPDDANARPDITNPGSLVPGSGSGSSSKATATAPNIDANLPFHPIDLNLADKPVNETLDEWIDSQKAVTAAMTEVDKSGLEMSKAEADHAALVKKGTATQDEWNNNAAALAKAQLDNQTATQNLTIAQMKAAADANKPAKGREGSRDGEGVTGSSILEKGPDFSPKGIGTFFTALLLDLAVGNPIGKSLAAKRGEDPSNPMYVSDVSSLSSQGSTTSSFLSALGIPGGSGSGTGATTPGPGNQGGAGAYGLQAPGTTNQSQDQVAAAIIQEGMKRGLTRDQIVAGLDVAKLESNYGANPMSHVHQNQSGTDVEGIFQQDPGYSGNHDDPHNAAGQFFDRFIQRGGTQMDPYTGAVKVQVGTYGGDYVRSQNQGSVYDRLAPSLVAPAAPASAAAAPAPSSSGSDSGGGLKDLIFGGGLGLPFNHDLKLSPDSFGGGGGGDPVPSHETYGARTPGNGLIWSPTKGWVPDGGPGLPLGMTPNAPAAPPPPAAPGALGGNPFAPGGALSAMPGPPSFTPAIPGAPGGLGPQAPGFAPMGGGRPAAVGGLGSSALLGAAGSSSAAAAPPLTTPMPTPGGGRPASGGTGKGGGTTLGSTAASIAGPALDAIAPGASIVAQKGGQLLDRAIGYGAQVAGIGISGLFETFGLNDSPLADPQKSIFGRLAGGLAGAHKSADNTAGQTQPPLKPPDDDKKAPDGSPASGNGSGPKPGPDGGNGAPLIGTQIINHTGDPDGQRIATDIDRHLSSGGVGNTR